MEDQFNVANIKYETTQMLVKDIEKYHTALDKVRRAVVTKTKLESLLLNLVSLFPRRCLNFTAAKLPKSTRSLGIFGASKLCEIKAMASQMSLLEKHVKIY